MADSLFKIVFEGQVREGVELDTAKANLAGLFKSEARAVQKLFNGQPVALKRGLTHTDAERYLKALNDAGVEARIEPDSDISLSLNEIASAPPQKPAHLEISPYAPPKAQVGGDQPEHSTLKVLSINGRIGRLRYLAWSLVLSAAALALVAVCLLTMNESLVAGGLLSAVVLVVFAVIGAQIGIQRLHDLGWSGWLLLLTMVPFIGSVFPFLMVLLPGTKGPNQFGPPPPPNSKGVKTLAVLWLLLLPIILIGLTAGGEGMLRDELELQTDEYEQSLPYDDEQDQDSALIVPVDVNKELKETQ
ncbi:DUF805 domain-containing protein [Pseudomonas amygdali]|uniref:DUF805 domain-containing protein n=1 Tax=Pseudomonas amygdali pv. tabaci TaxID=322 RepID=A0A3M6HWH3_PSEAJ|nr:DUF805 domain-containing protein [Pseudomonas amygdali]RMW09251.1 hypothetical protein ALP03_03138 [Pseudomonas amygdali pv. tabaci]